MSEEVSSKATPVADEQKRRPVYLHPLVTIACILSTLISTPLAFYFYYASIRRPDLSVYFHPVRTQILQAYSDSRLLVSYDSQPLKGPIVAMQFAIWNAGEQPIRQDDVLETITLHASGVRILDVKFRQPARKGVGLTVDDLKKAQGELSFAWKVLEPNDGAAVQLIYEGDPGTQFEVSGSVVGQSHVSKVARREPDIPVPETAWKNSRMRSPWILVLFAVLGLGGVFFVGVSLRLALAKHGRRASVACLRETGPAIPVGLGVLIIAVWKILEWFRDRGIPFDF